MKSACAVRAHRRISEIGRTAWDACALTRGPENPFVAYDFLHALEESGCVSERAGWGPQYLALDDGAGGIAAVAPLYLKAHSQGEYIFDHAWADAYERAGGRYYPKLLCASPFSPVTGPRLLVAAGANLEAGRRGLLAGVVGLAERFGIANAGFNFPTREEWEFLRGEGLLGRKARQYHWRNAGYASFDEFLATLSSARRKVIRRERREAGRGLDIVALTGGELSEAHWDAFFAFYMDTGSRKWGRPYLNRRFFSLLSDAMADRILLVMARRGGRWIAGALNLIGGDCLFGRNWGCVEHVPFLHFELCYYQAIEQAIARGLARVEAGAQGEHKITRGYLPVEVYSAHYIADPGLRNAVARYLEQERPAVESEIEWLAEAYSPYRQASA
ncbi:MAG TPA: GNAT family N-acetyltransferase [Caulobacteraceae bacterium]|nr:GNAT family N-acetyltransferase [Caulobacteraceae bacterium]